MRPPTNAQKPHTDLLAVFYIYNIGSYEHGAANKPLFVCLLSYFLGFYFAKGKCWMLSPNGDWLFWQIWSLKLEFFQPLCIVVISQSHSRQTIRPRNFSLRRFIVQDHPRQLKSQRTVLQFIPIIPKLQKPGSIPSPFAHTFPKLFQYNTTVWELGPWRRSLGTKCFS